MARFARVGIYLKVTALLVKGEASLSLSLKPHQTPSNQTGQLDITGGCGVASCPFQELVFHAFQQKGSKAMIKLTEVYVDTCGTGSLRL